MRFLKTIIVVKCYSWCSQPCAVVGADDMKGEMVQKLFWRLSRKLATIIASAPSFTEREKCAGEVLGLESGQWMSPCNSIVAVWLCVWQFCWNCFLFVSLASGSDYNSVWNLLGREGRERGKKKEKETSVQSGIQPVLYHVVISRNVAYPWKHGLWIKKYSRVL